MLNEVVRAVGANCRHMEEVLVCVDIVCLTMLFVRRHIAKHSVTECPGACRVGAREAGLDTAHDLLDKIL